MLCLVGKLCLKNLSIVIHQHCLSAQGLTICGRVDDFFCSSVNGKEAVRPSMVLGLKLVTKTINHHRVGRVMLIDKCLGTFETVTKALLGSRLVVKSDRPQVSVSITDVNQQDPNFCLLET